MLKIIEVYKGANIYKSGDDFLLIYENSKNVLKVDHDVTMIRQLKRCKSLKSAKSFITRNKRFYVGYQLNHYSMKREDIYHTTKFY